MSAIFKRASLEKNRASRRKTVVLCRTKSSYGWNLETPPTTKKKQKNRKKSFYRGFFFFSFLGLSIGFIVWKVLILWDKYSSKVNLLWSDIMNLTWVLNRLFMSWTRRSVKKCFIELEPNVLSISIEYMGLWTLWKASILAGTHGHIRRTLPTGGTQKEKTRRERIPISSFSMIYIHTKYTNCKMIISLFLEYSCCGRNIIWRDVINFFRLTRTRNPELQFIYTLSS